MTVLSERYSAPRGEPVLDRHVDVAQLWRLACDADRQGEKCGQRKKSVSDAMETYYTELGRDKRGAKQWVAQFVDILGFFDPSADWRAVEAGPQMLGFGRVQRGQSAYGLPACDMSITSADHGETGMRIQIDAMPTSSRDIQLHDLVIDQKPGGLRIVRPRFENTRDVEGCVHEVDFADGSAISVLAVDPSNLAADVFCMIGKATLAAVVATLLSGHVPRRRWLAGTLASRPDLCGMVPPDVRALVPGLGSAGLQALPDGARCVWTADTRVSLTWEIGAARSASNHRSRRRTRSMS
jgi:hypothetical protein